jgi:hypothetical protein
MEKEYGDITFRPRSLVLLPFTDDSIEIIYTPTRQTRTTVTLLVTSPYSSHKIPILLHAGTAVLTFDGVDTLDFGMFEKKSRPHVMLKVRNEGTVVTSFTVADSVKPSMFHFVGHKGILQPGKSSEVTVTYTKNEVCSFRERLIIKSDIINRFNHVYVEGHSEEAVVRDEEINFLNLGTCPVLDPTSGTISVKNHGKFPFSFQIKSAYPLKVSPASGEIPGGESRPLTITWVPSGSYELRTQVAMSSNIGVFNITVRGRSTFPELALKASNIDFGVCAMGHMYHESISMINRYEHYI